MTHTNFYQTIPQTREEKIAMYMKYTKEVLASMLAERDMARQAAEQVIKSSTISLISLSGKTYLDPNG